MRRVVVTGMGLLTAAGMGARRFEEALRRGEPLARPHEVRLPRRGSRSILFAPLEGFDASDLIPPGVLRRMAPEGQIVTCVFLLASRDARAEARGFAAERTGTYLGSGFGCLLTTGEYLRGIFSEGLAAASPLLFSESLASAPLGHAAIALDARGPSISFSSGDASAVTALGECWRAIRGGRIERAVCGGFEKMSPELLKILARLASRTGERPFVGEGAAAFVLEERETAVRSGGRILAEVVSVGQAGDPDARPSDWSHDERVWAAAHRQALHRIRSGGTTPGVVFRHAPPSARAAAAESRALERLGGNGRGPAVRDVRRVFGDYAAAGGLSVAAGVLACGAGRETILISAGSWGGGVTAAVLAPAGA